MNHCKPFVGYHDQEHCADEPLDLDALIGEVGLRLLRYERSGGTLTIERVQTTILDVFDAAKDANP